MLKLSRTWAMPNKWTFLIPPIAGLLERYNVGKGWVDPFAGMNSPAEITNDINPEMRAQHNLHALEFASILDDEWFIGVLFDPPYSLRQVKECYNNIGINLLSREESNYFPNDIKKELAPKIKLNGFAISFGWNSGGFGMKNGFKIIEILLVPHGGKRNDTIVTVERKFDNQTNIGL